MIPLYEGLIPFLEKEALSSADRRLEALAAAEHLEGLSTVAEAPMMRSPHARVGKGSCNCSPDSFGCVSPLDEREQTPSAAGEGLGSSCRRSALAGDPVGESNSSSGYRLRPLPSRLSLIHI